MELALQIIAILAILFCIPQYLWFIFYYRPNTFIKRKKKK